MTQSHSSKDAQEEIIKELRQKVVRIDTTKPTTPIKIEEKDVLEKAKEAGKTIDDDELNSIWNCFFPYDKEKTLEKWQALLEQHVAAKLKERKDM